MEPMLTTIPHSAGKPILLDGKLVCSQCGQIMRAKLMRDEFKSMTGESGDRLYETQTLVGYCSPPGHNHDDNCWTLGYVCPSGHTMKIGKRRRCPACEWVGKESCGCHDCLKVDEFPEPGSAASPAACKKCGGEGQLFCWDGQYPEIGPETYTVHCEDCNNTGPIKPSEGEAVAAWNEQPNDPSSATRPPNA